MRLFLLIILRDAFLLLSYAEVVRYTFPNHTLFQCLLSRAPWVIWPIILLHYKAYRDRRELKNVSAAIHQTATTVRAVIEHYPVMRNRP